MEGRERLRTGNFNTVNFEEQSDGSKIVILSKRGEKNHYRFAVKNLYKENEEMLWEETIDP